MRRRARQRILDGALEVFAERGPHAASMSEIAARAGVSKGLAYRYFESKEELLARVLRSRLNDLRQVVDSLDELPAPEARLRHLIDELIDQVAREPQAFRLYLMLALEMQEKGGRGTAVDTLHAEMESYMNALRELVASLGSSEPAIDALLLRSTLMGLCIRLACGNEHAAAADVRVRLQRLFLDPRSGRGSR